MGHSVAALDLEREVLDDRVRQQPRAGRIGLRLGAAGCHMVRNGKPYAIVDTSWSDTNVIWSVAGTHELEEMWVNPWGTRMTTDGSGDRWLTEIADPVEDYHHPLAGVQVSDFVTPNWFENLGSLQDNFGWLHYGGYDTFDFSCPSGFSHYKSWDGWHQLRRTATACARTRPGWPPRARTVHHSRALRCDDAHRQRQQGRGVPGREKGLNMKPIAIAAVVVIFWAGAVVAGADDRPGSSIGRGDQGTDGQTAEPAWTVPRLRRQGSRHGASRPGRAGLDDMRGLQGHDLQLAARPEPHPGSTRAIVARVTPSLQQAPITI